jgi:hypothetical protein
MTGAQPVQPTLLWYEQTDKPMRRRNADVLEVAIGMHVSALHDPGQWVLGSKVVHGADLVSASILFLTRRLRSPGIRFEMQTMAEDRPDTEALHQAVKRYLIDFNNDGLGPDGNADWRSGQWRPAGSTVIDLKAAANELRRQDFALARGHLTARREVAMSALGAAGVGNTAMIDLVFAADRPAVSVTVGIGLDRPVERIRLVVATGEERRSVRISAHGIATVADIAIDQRSDLLHVSLEWSA